jgi:hypothetical protein
MNTEPLVRLTRNAERPDPEIHDELESAANPNKWSTVVRSWVVEFRQRGRNERVPAFDSLLKNPLPATAPADGNAF